MTCILYRVSSQRAKEKVFIYALPTLLVVIGMGELKVVIPEDIGIELGKISKEDWQLLFSRFLRRELEEIREIESIVSKSKLTEEQAKELADEVSLSIAKRLLKKILSGDKGLKECLPDRVITPSEAIEILFGRTAP